MVTICQEFGWTYKEYLEQPSWFLELVKKKLQLDSELQKKELDKVKSQQRRLR